MIRRFFLGAAALGISALPNRALPQQPALAKRGPALLTVTGAVTRANRGAFDSVLDQMMAKQRISFDKAHAFDFAALTALPALAIRPRLEYDAQARSLSGPLLADVVKAAGGPSGDSARLVLRAVDGYAVAISMAEARKYRFIVATHLEGRPMPLGGLGPLWAIYDADRYPDKAAMPLDQRFASCPWALYHIDVAAA